MTWEDLVMLCRDWLVGVSLADSNVASSTVASVPAATSVANASSGSVVA